MKRHRNVTENFFPPPPFGAVILKIAEKGGVLWHLVP